MQVFLEHLKKRFAERAQDPLKGIREKAWERFLALGLPEKRVGAFQYLPLSELYQSDHQQEDSIFIDREKILSHIFPKYSENYLVFIDGIFQADLSKAPKQIVISPLAKALTTYGHFIKHRMSSQGSTEKDPFVFLNAALQEEGLFVFIPPHLKLETPIQVLQLFTKPASPRIQVFLGLGAEVKWVSTSLFLATPPLWVNSVLDISLEEGAHFQHFDFLEGKETSWHFQALRASLKRNSNFRSLSVNSGARSLRNDFHISLMEENAEATLEGVWVLGDRKQTHTHVLMEHLAPHCHSMQRFKGVLGGTSQSSFEGKIFVHQKAQKTQAYQINNNLLLDQRAIVNSKPNLEIFADDVKASHGATVGQMDAKQLFYLMTRGIPEEVARRLLVMGFCREIIDRVSCPTLHKTLCHFLEKSL